MTAVWPDCSASTTPGVMVRDQLDYLVWIAEAIEPVGFHATEEVERWRPRIDRAYLALIDAMVPGHGDPLPPDVPPSVRPGTWPDVPSATIPGMTVRHQLTVIRTVSQACRANRAFPHQAGDIATWAARVQTAHDALDHGPALTMPADARTEPPPPPAPKKAPKRKAPAPPVKPAKITRPAQTKTKTKKTKTPERKRTPARGRKPANTKAKQATKRTQKRKAQAPAKRSGAKPTRKSKKR